jgi:hypothetical protein
VRWIAKVTEYRSVAIHWIDSKEGPLWQIGVVQVDRRTSEHDLPGLFNDQPYGRHNDRALRGIGEVTDNRPRSSETVHSDEYVEMDEKDIAGGSLDSRMCRLTPNEEGALAGIPEVTNDRALSSRRGHANKRATGEPVDIFGPEGVIDDEDTR